MHINKKILIGLVGLVTLSACELDNYQDPSASLSGRIIDAETGEPIQQDIVNGSTIQLSEHGYDPVQVQYLPIDNDGSYANNMLIPNTYTVEATRGNFVAPSSQEVQISKNVSLDFKVIPYLRIKDASIQLANGKISATFKIEQTQAGLVTKVGLYGHSEVAVGATMNLVSTELTLNRQVDVSEVFTLTIDVASNKVLKTGKTYFFRIGAISNATEAKPNYAPVVEINN